DLARYVDEEAGIGMPTLTDIIDELRKPGRDPRDAFETVQFREGVTEPKDLKPGMALEGVVTNIVAFGAFVDIGVHQDGLVHVSQLADRFVRDPNDVVKVGQKVRVTVLSVDLERNRIALTMKTGAQPETVGGGRKGQQGRGQQKQAAAKKPALQPKPGRTRARLTARGPLRQGSTRRRQGRPEGARHRAERRPRAEPDRADHEDRCAARNGGWRSQGAAGQGAAEEGSCKEAGTAAEAGNDRAERHAVPVVRDLSRKTMRTGQPCPVRIVVRAMPGLYRARSASLALPADRHRARSRPLSLAVPHRLSCPRMSGIHSP